MCDANNQIEVFKGTTVDPKSKIDFYCTDKPAGVYVGDHTFVFNYEDGQEWEFHYTGDTERNTQRKFNYVTLNWSAIQCN